MLSVLMLSGELGWTYVTSGGLSNLRRCSVRVLPREPEPEPELGVSRWSRSFLSRVIRRDCGVKAEAFEARYLDIGVSGVRLDILL
jgi:hypothetical protein